MAKVSNRKLAALRAAAKRGGRAAAGGVKGSAIQVLGGALTCWGNQKLAENSAFYRSQWWIGPATIGVVGFMLKRKAKFAPIGNAMLGAAGYSLAQNYALAATNTAAGTSPDTTGIYDVGAIYNPSQALPLLSSGAATAPGAATSRYDTSVAASL